MTDLIAPPLGLLDLVSSGAEAEIAKKILQWAAPILRRQGADQELEACVEWVDWKWSGIKSRELRAARRPKLPSLKEQAQVELDRLIALIPSEGALAMAEPIRRALEALDD